MKEDKVDVIEAEDAISEVRPLKKKGNDPLNINAGGMITVDITSPRGKFKLGKSWHNYPLGRHKVTKEARDILKARGDLG